LLSADTPFRNTRSYGRERKIKENSGEARNPREVEGEREKIWLVVAATTVYFALYDSLNTGLKAHAHT